jgi:DNA polymerase
MRSPAAHIDFETYSVVDLKKAGLHKYATHASTGVWCMSWRIGGGNTPVHRFDPFKDECPWELLAHIEEGGEVVVHNAAFERAIWNKVMRRPSNRPWWPELKLRQQNCTMARAQVHGFPGQLEKLGPVLGSPYGKDMEGAGLMLRVCRPRKFTEAGEPIWWNSDPSWPEKLERLQKYCDRDVDEETFADTILPQLSASERDVWEFDQIINERGVRIDRPLVERCITVADEAQRRINYRMTKATNGAVKKVSETAKIVTYLQERGVPCKSIKKGDHDELLIYSDLVDDPNTKLVVELRRDGYKSSTAKFPAMLKCASEEDDRARGLLNYSGAIATGRWAGRLIQPQNFPRVDVDRDLPTVLAIIELLKGQYSPKEICDIIEVCYGEVMPWLAKMLRAMLIAGEGKEFIGGDLSNIEGRIAAWMVGEQWKLEAFRAYDRKEGPDLYNVAYARSFNVDVTTVRKDQRQIGKVQELALGYQGSVGAFVSMVNTYQMKIYEIAAAVRAVTDNQTWDRTAAKFTKRMAYGLPEDWWTAIKVVVDAWRGAHPKIVQGWWDLQDAAIEAVSRPGVLVPVIGHNIAYAVLNDCLVCRLPSGRTLQYWHPRLVNDEEEVEVFDDDGNLIEVKTYGRNRKKVRFSGLHKKTKQWTDTLSLYGGHQFENIDQAIARDCLVVAMNRVEAAGYPVVLTVHDENLSEVDEGFGDEKEYARLMSTNTDWNAGLPMAAAAWRDKRYVK